MDLWNKPDRWMLHGLLHLRPRFKLNPRSFMSLHTNPPSTPPSFKEGQTVYGNYELVKTFTPPSSTVPIQKWRSTKTGLSVVWAGIPGPIVNGTFAVVSLSPGFPSLSRLPLINLSFAVRNLHFWVKSLQRYSTSLFPFHFSSQAFRLADR